MTKFTADITKSFQFWKYLPTLSDFFQIFFGKIENPYNFVISNND